MIRASSKPFDEPCIQVVAPLACASFYRQMIISIYQWKLEIFIYNKNQPMINSRRFNSERGCAMQLNNNWLGGRHNKVRVNHLHENL